MSTVQAVESADATVRVRFWAFESTGLGSVTISISAAKSADELQEYVTEREVLAKFTRKWGWRDFSGVTWLRPDHCQLTAGDWDAKLFSFLPKRSAAADASPINTVTFILKPPASAQVAAGAGVLDGGAGEPPAKRPRLGTDVSRDYVKEFLGRAADVSSVDAFTRELTTPIPLLRTNAHIPPGWIQETLPLQNVADGGLQEDHDTLVCSTLFPAVSEPAPTGRSKETIASFALNVIQKVWRDVLRFGGLPFVEDRYTTNRSAAPTMGLRPDYCLWMQDALLIKSEHQADEVDLDKAIDDLTEKMNCWNPLALPGLPFLPAFVVAGRFLQFAVLVPNRGEANAAKVLRLYDLFVPMDRFEAIRIALNMARVLASLRGLLPPSAEVYPLYKRVNRGDGDYMVFYPDHVEKNTRFAAPQEVYDLLGCGKPRSLIPSAIHVTRVVRNEADVVQLHLRPVCQPRAQPATETDLRKAVRCVLLAINYLHANGFVHRDVRWENILRTVSGDWILADFELAAKFGETAAMIKTTLLPPECAANPHCAYMPAGDIYRVGCLFNSWKQRSLSVEGQAFAHRLCAVDPSARPTAESLLEDTAGWLAHA